MHDTLLNILFWVGVPLLIVLAMIVWAVMSMIVFDELTTIFSDEESVGPDDSEYYN